MELTFEKKKDRHDLLFHIPEARKRFSAMVWVGDDSVRVRLMSKEYHKHLLNEERYAREIVAKEKREAQLKRKYKKLEQQEMQDVAYIFDYLRIYTMGTEEPDWDNHLQKTRKRNRVFGQHIYNSYQQFCSIVGSAVASRQLFYRTICAYYFSFPHADVEQSARDGRTVFDNLILFSDNKIDKLLPNDLDMGHRYHQLHFMKIYHLDQVHQEKIKEFYEKKQPNP